MKRRWKASVALALVTGIGLALAGCTQSPLAPSNPLVNGGTTEAPPILTFTDGTADYVTAPVDSALNGVWAGTPTTRIVSASAVIDGSRGGRVRAGRFSVTLPPGCFEGLAAVTVSMADSTVMICDLQISPPTANKFSKPAELSADLTGLSADATTLTMYWYDPTRRTWVNLAAKSETSDTHVTASLEHFSTYGAGKAGW
jgi:hypothetical protein